MKNEGLVILGTLGCIILGILASIIAYFVGKDKFTPQERDVVATLFNFNISLFIICILINFIPIIGQLLTLVIFVISIVYAILAYIAAKENKPFKAFTIYQFVK